MKKVILLKKIDYLFLYTLLFFASFIVFNYFIPNRTLCFFVSFLSGYLVFCFIKFLITRRSNVVIAKKVDKQNIALLRQSLIAGGTIFAFEYLKNAFNGEIKTFGIESEDAIYYADFSKPELTLFDLNKIKCTILLSSKDKFIIGDKISDELKAYLENSAINVKFISYSEIYFDYVKGKLPLPTSPIKQKNPTKNTLKSLVKIAFAKDKAKGYFVNGILIFLFSFLYPFKNYYRIFSLVLFVFAIVCTFKNSKIIDN